VETLERKLPPLSVVDHIQHDIREFQKANGLSDVIVVNLASTEPVPECGDALDSVQSLGHAIEGIGKCPVPASVLYAFAAIDAGFPYINFTPSLGSRPPAVQKLALERRIPHMGQDGKTGETLVKTVLAPMFAARNLDVLAWESHNILGNRDGEVLKNPENCAAKIADKDKSLRGILGDRVKHSRVRIDYVPSLGDWKTAWDFIHFKGFLDVQMTMQFIWQGCDSALAAPLVIDLVRLVDFAHRKGEVGLMPHLACFFKSPLGVDEQDFSRQFAMLAEYVKGHSCR
jgi:myo-inositol-1-phosphate synthase